MSKAGQVDPKKWVSRAVFENLLKQARVARRRDKQAYDHVEFINQALNRSLESRAEEIAALKGEVEALKNTVFSLDRERDTLIASAASAGERCCELQAERERWMQERQKLVGAVRATAGAL